MKKVTTEKELGEALKMKRVQLKLQAILQRKQ